MDDCSLCSDIFLHIMKYTSYDEYYPISTSCSTLYAFTYHMYVKKYVNDLHILMEIAAKSGDLQQMEYLHTTGMSYNCAMKMLIQHRHIHILKYLYESNPINTFYVDSSMDFSYLPIVKLIYKHDEHYRHWAIRNAAQYGHLDIVKYLHDIIIHDSTNTLLCAAQYGHLNIVKYLCENSDALKRQALSVAIRYNHMNIVKYLYVDDDIQTSYNIRVATCYNHTEILKFLKLKRYHNIRRNILKCVMITCIGTWVYIIID